MADEPRPHADHSPRRRASRAARGRPAAGGCGRAVIVVVALSLGGAARPRHHSGRAARECRHLSMGSAMRRAAGLEAGSPAQSAAAQQPRRRCRSARSAGTRQIMQHPRRRQYAARGASSPRRPAPPATATRACRRPDIPEPRRPDDLRHLQAAPRLSLGRPRPSANDRRGQGACGRATWPASRPITPRRRRNMRRSAARPFGRAEHRASWRGKATAGAGFRPA